MTAIKAAIFADSSKPQQMHSYPYHQLLCYYSGSGKMQIADRKYPVGVNSVVYIPPEAEHTEYVSNCELEYVSVLFDTDLFLSDGKALFVEDDETFFSELRQVVICNQLDGKIYRNIRDSLLEAVLNKISLIGNMTKEEIMVYKYKLSIVETIAKSDYTITDFMNEQSITRSNISRRFRNVTDETAKKFMDNQKIEYAKQLMIHDTDDTTNTEDIAKRCGYEEEYYFSRVFKGKTGMSIAEFIKKKNQ